jgi:hypothetical protein
MKKVMEQLFALQKLQFGSRTRTDQTQVETEKLRSKIPLPILDYYDRFVLRDKKGVAIARNGVCSECHLRITGGKLVGLSSTAEVHRCDNCGRYLYLPEDELASLSKPKPPIDAPAKQSPRKVLARLL